MARSTHRYYTLIPQRSYEAFVGPREKKPTLRQILAAYLVEPELIGELLEKKPPSDDPLAPDVDLPGMIPTKLDEIEELRPQAKQGALETVAKFIVINSPDDAMVALREWSPRVAAWVGLSLYRFVRGSYSLDVASDLADRLERDLLALVNRSRGFSVVRTQRDSRELFDAVTIGRMTREKTLQQIAFTLYQTGMMSSTDPSYFHSQDVIYHAVQSIQLVSADQRRPEMSSKEILAAVIRVMYNACFTFPG